MLAQKVDPESPRSLPARRPRRFTRTYPGSPVSFRRPPYPITELGPVQVVASALSCPALATAGARMSEAVLLRRILSPSFGHRKWWLGEGHQWEVQQEGQKLLLDS